MIHHEYWDRSDTACRFHRGNARRSVPAERGAGSWWSSCRALRVPLGSFAVQQVGYCNFVPRTLLGHVSSTPTGSLTAPLYSVSQQTGCEESFDARTGEYISCPPPDSLVTTSLDEAQALLDSGWAYLFGASFGDARNCSVGFVEPV